MIFDLAIIGGGPAGCGAAISAARRGASVLLLERGTFPRQKVCGEFVSAESLGVLQNLLANNVASFISTAPPLSEAQIFLDGATLNVKVKPAAASITRFDLDCALWNASINTGVTALTSASVQKIIGNGPFAISTINQVFEARSVINATGRWSNLSSFKKRSHNNGQKWLGIKAHFDELSSSRVVDLYFFEGGYCGVQPVGASPHGPGTRINACAMVRADVASTISELLNQHPLLQERSRSWSIATDPVSTAPLIFHDPDPVQNSVLQAGDAAMFVDPFIGDGISLALRSGVLAADCLTRFFRKECSLEQACARYSSEYRERFRHILKNSSRLRSLLHWPRVVRKPVLSLFAKTPFVTSQLVRMTR
jgi:menaquinone-9 beta-reductase